MDAGLPQHFGTETLFLPRPSRRRSTLVWSPEKPLSPRIYYPTGTSAELPTPPQREEYAILRPSHDSSWLGGRKEIVEAKKFPFVPIVISILVQALRSRNRAGGGRPFGSSPPLPFLSAGRKKFEKTQKKKKNGGAAIGDPKTHAMNFSFPKKEDFFPNLFPLQLGIFLPRDPKETGSTKEASPAKEPETKPTAIISPSPPRRSPLLAATNLVSLDLPPLLRSFRSLNTPTVARKQPTPQPSPQRPVRSESGCATTPRFRPYVAKLPWHGGARAFLSQLFPRYGHYCGPNWSSGKDRGSVLWDMRPIDWLDLCCYCHDIGYDTDDQAKLLNADLAFLECLERPRMPEKGDARAAELYQSMCIAGLRNVLIPYRRQLVRLRGRSQSVLESMNGKRSAGCDLN